MYPAIRDLETSASVLIFIRNTPRAYAWGSTDALPDMLGYAATGEPQAELWLGDHPGSPARIAKASPAPLTLIELIESDPERYGVDGGSLPFLLKVLAIGAPLSLQAHPDLAQARAGFAAENARGVPIDAPERNYRDANHKPELLVALSDVTALSGFRALEDAANDLHALAAAGDEPLLARAAERLSTAAPEQVRLRFLDWAFDDAGTAGEVLAALERAVRAEPAPAAHGPRLDPDRLECLRQLIEHYPGDPGVLVSLLLHHVRLEPGEAVYLGARQLHAYLSGIAVEVMAASDNVLRAGLTEKHIDVAEMRAVLDPGELPDPRYPGARLAPGLTAWRPGIRDFSLLRARVGDADDAPAAGSHIVPDSADHPHALFAPAGLDETAAEVRIDATDPLVLITTRGRVRVSRPDGELSETANVARGQSLYISAGEPLTLTGRGEAFLATVGVEHTPG